MLNDRGWATSSEIQINVWLQGRRLMSTEDYFTLQTFNPPVHSFGYNSKRQFVISLLLHNEHFKLLRTIVLNPANTYCYSETAGCDNPCQKRKNVRNSASVTPDNLKSPTAPQNSIPQHMNSEAMNNFSCDKKNNSEQPPKQQ